MFTRDELDEMEAVLISCIRMLTNDKNRFLSLGYKNNVENVDMMIESRKKLLNRVINVKYEKCP